MKCEICEKEFKELINLSNHIRVHKIKPKDYYDKYLKKENEGICRSHNKINSCKKYTKFVNMITGYRNFCSFKCRSNNDEIRKETRKTNLKKYGYEYIFHKDEIKEKNKINRIKNKDLIQEKIKQTNIEKYGVENVFQSEEIKEKIKETNLKKYGVEYPNQNKKIFEKVKETNLKKYGVENTLQSEEIKEKVKQTNIKKYGNVCSLHGEEIQKKVKQTNIEKYGFENPFQNEEIKEKIKQKNLGKSEKENELIKNKRKETNLEKFIIKVNKLLEYLNLQLLSSYNNCKELIEVKCLKCGLIFKTNYFSLYQNYGKCPNCFPIYKSNLELEILEFIKSIENSEIIENDRKILSYKELDIYIPSKNIAIEFDGLYWHSEGQGKDKNYHLNKTNSCKQKNIQLIHIFEDEWILKQDVVKSRLKQILGINNSERIHARKCKIKEISPKIKNEFLNKFHIQGSDRSNIKLGAFYDNELISVMTFSHGSISRKKYNDINIWELSRFCSNSKYHIPGIASKLLTYFKRNYEWKEIYSYADRRWSQGNLYYKLGFELESITKPNYWYVKDGFRIHRFNLRKKYNEPKDIPEWILRSKEGYFRIWDCGHYKFKQ